MAKKAYIGVPAYTVLEYIESTGTQYIDTGLRLNQDSKLEMLVSHYDTNTQRMAFGSRSSATQNNFSVVSGPVGGVMSIVTDFDNYTNNRLAYVIDEDESFEISISKEKLKINDLEQAVSTYDNFTTPATAYLFSGNGSYPAGYLPAIMRLYYCKIYNNSVLARDFVPCYRNSDGVVGLYDKANDVFYTNAGSGTFVAGAETGEVISTGTARQNKVVYIGVDNVARKVKKIYGGVGGLASLFWGEEKAVSLISFAIAYNADNVTWNLTAEDGMTFAEWMDSDYNTIGAAPYNNYGISIPYDGVSSGLIYMNTDPSEVILQGKTYTTMKTIPSAPPVITFYVGKGTPDAFNAYYGMTWNEFADSTFNPDYYVLGVFVSKAFVVSDGRVSYKSGVVVGVVPTDVIEDGKTYSTGIIPV